MKRTQEMKMTDDNMVQMSTRCSLRCFLQWLLIVY